MVVETNTTVYLLSYPQLLKALESAVGHGIKGINVGNPIKGVTPTNEGGYILSVPQPSTESAQITTTYLISQDEIAQIYTQATGIEVKAQDITAFGVQDPFFFFINVQ